MVYNWFSLGLLVYVFWNIAGFALIMVDKRRAKRGEWRIKERTFFLCALAFAAPGILLGVHVFRHKTRHWAFRIGMPLLCIFNLVCGCLLWRQGLLL